MGLGWLYIDHLTITDLSNDCAPFLFTGGTRLSIENTAWWGTASGTAACNDAITLGSQISGGTITVLGLASNDPYQGYGTQITNNDFNFMQHVLQINTYASFVGFKDNNIYQSNGSATANDAPILCTGVSGQANVGNKISYYHFERGGYYYGVKFVQYCDNNTIDGNDTENTGVNWVATLRIADTTSTFNYYRPGNDNTPGSANISNAETTNSQTKVSSLQSDPSVFTQPITFTNGALLINQNVAGPTGWELLDSSGNYYIPHMQSGTSYGLDYFPSGGAVRTPFLFITSSTTAETLQGQSSGTFTVKNSAGALALLANSGSALQLGDSGNTTLMQFSSANITMGKSGQTIKINAGAYFIPQTATIATITAITCNSSVAGARATITDSDSACVIGTTPVHTACVVGTNCYTCPVFCGEAGGAGYAWLAD